MDSQVSDKAEDVWERALRLRRAKFATIDSARLAAHIETQCPGSKVSVENIVPLGNTSGMSNGIAFFTANIETPGRVESRELVLRYSPGVPSLIRQKSFPDEFLSIRAARGGHVLAPAAFWPDLSGDALGFPGFVMDKVEAGSVPSAIFTGGPIADADAATRKEMLLQAAGLHGRLRKAAIGEDKVPHLLRKGEGRNAVERELSWWLKEAQLSVAHDNPLMAPINELYQWMMSHIPPARAATLTHGDGQICNIMYRDGKAVCWLDWELAYLGHQETDLMMVIMNIDLTMPISVTLPGIPTLQEQISRFEREAGMTVEYWEYFSLLMVFKWLVSLVWSPADESQNIHLKDRLLEYRDRYFKDACNAVKSYGSNLPSSARA